ncbi:MAG: Crp/Fnr family transcriptional regulator [Polyangiaceae bacterium]
MFPEVVTDRCRALADRFLRPILSGWAEVPEREWTHLLTLLSLTDVPKSASLTEAGVVADRFGLIASGVMCKRHLTVDGGGFVRAFAAEGEFVGAYVSMLTQTPSALRVEALQDTELLVVPYGAMEDLYARHACWERIGRKLAEAALVEREQRATELLTADATARYVNFLRTQRQVLGRVREADIASYLGITPVSLSRIKAQLAVRSAP